MLFVLAAGPSLWWGGERGDVVDWFAAVGLAWCFVPIGLLAWTGAGVHPAASIGLLAGTLVFVLPVVGWISGRRWLFGTNSYVLVPLRLAAATSIAVGLSHNPERQVIGVCLIGALAGCEATLSFHAVGIYLEPLPSLGRLAISSLNLGAILGLVVAVVLQGRGAIVPALQLYGSFWLMAVVVVGLVVTFQAGERIVQDRRDADLRLLRSHERLERAHWIHDEVCAELRLVRLQLDDRTIGLNEVGVALSELDHRMRLRQLDDQMLSGTVRLAEVIQPFARKLQDNGVHLTDMPLFNAGHVELTAATAGLIRRAVSVLTSNAMNAGAFSVGIRASATANFVVIEVEDDAGGFRPDEIPLGRGLDRLRHDVDSFTVLPTVTGSVVSVCIARDGA